MNGVNAQGERVYGVDPSRASPWRRGRALAERAEDAGAATQACHAQADAQLLERWRRDFPDESALAERLALAGLEPGQLPAILAAAATVRATPQPDWWLWAMDSLAPGSRSPVPEQDLDVDAQLGTGCVRLVAPLVGRARRHLTTRAEALVEADAELPAPFAAATIAPLLVRPLALELAGLCVPAVTLELTAARLSGSLHGADAQERAAGFLRDLGRAERARELFAEHPALLRLLHDRVRLGTQAAEELLERLAADWARLVAELFAGTNPGTVTALEPLGDSHEGGRRVTRLSFSGGARLVYKPRSMAADAAYHNLLRWMGGAGDGHPFRPVACVLGEETYGWQEWVAASACDSPAQVERYFGRLGAQLAVLHALRATDLHHENIIACGEQPVIVDLECLFHPRLGGARAAVVDPLIAETGMDCVLRVGLLPRADATFGVDMSGLGRDPDAPAQAEGVGLVDDGTDEARLGRLAIELGPGTNAARLGDQPVRPSEHLERLAEGFSSAYRLLRRHCDELLSPGGALAAFAQAPTRIVMRPSKAYADLLGRQVSDPAALDDGLGREEILNALWRGVRRRPDLARAVVAETHDLWHGDVPRVTGRPGSADGRHHARGTLEGLLEPHAVEPVDCVRRLDEADHERQLAFLRASVAAAADLAEPRHRVPAPAPAPDRDGLLEAAGEAARRLETLALHEDGRAGWLAPIAVAGHFGSVLQPEGAGLARGQAGVTLFLATCADITGDDRTHALSRSALAQLLWQLDAGSGHGDLGLWAGTGGVVWALVRLADALDDGLLLERAAELALRRLADARTEERLGVGDGLAGWAVGLSALTRRTADARLLAESERCAARLCEASPPTGGGMLGAPGTGLALLGLADVLDERDVAAAGGALVRRGAEAIDGDGSWASGAAGSTAALAVLVRRGGFAQTVASERGALRASLTSTRRLGLGRDHSLATGDLGALCALRLAALALPDPQLGDDVERLAAATLASVASAGSLCSGPGGVEEPGLLTGVAGVGWGWLELAGGDPIRHRSSGERAV